MNQYDIDLINFMNTLVLSELADSKWIHSQTDEKDLAAWNNGNLLRLANCTLFLDPEINAYELGLRIASSIKEQEKLRTSLLGTLKIKNIEYFEKPKVISEDFFKLLWSWIKDDYEFKINYVRKNYEKGIITRPEARALELQQFLVDKLETTSAFMSEKCSSPVWFKIQYDSLSLAMRIKTKWLDNDSFQTALYYCSTNPQPPYGIYSRKHNQITVNTRLIAVSAGLLQNLLSKYSLPDYLSPELKQWLLPVPEVIEPRDMQLAVVYHELGYRYSDSFKEYFGLQEISGFQNSPILLKEMIADLYAIYKLRTHSAGTDLIKLRILLHLLDNSWLYPNRDNSNESKLEHQIYQEYQAINKISTHVAISDDVESEIFRLSNLMVQNHLENGYDLSVTAKEFTDY